MIVPEKNYLQVMSGSSQLFGMNDVFIEGLYEEYLANPAAVDLVWRTYFDAMQVTPGAAREVAHSPIQRAFAALPETDYSGGAAVHDADLERKQVSVLQLINAHRFLGVRAAKLDPLKRFQKPEVPELNPGFYGLSDADMGSMFETGSLVGGARMTLREIMLLLRQTYCGSIGSEYMYMSDIPQKRWIQGRLEGVRGQAGHDTVLRRRILERLTAAETLERYLHTKYVGQKTLLAGRQ